MFTRSSRRPSLISALVIGLLAALLGPAAHSDPAPVPATVSLGTDFDLQGFIDGEIKAGKKQVVVPPGRYRVTPKGARHLVLKHLEDLEIIATGVEMVCTQTTQAISIEDCKNLQLKGLTIDYDPLPYTEGRITALAPDKSWVEFEIFPGYPINKLEERVEIYDPATGELRRGDAGWEQQFEPLGERRFRIAKRKGYRFNEKSDTEQVGDILVTNDAFTPGGNSGHAIVSSNCIGLKLEDITLYASNCFGFLEDRCDGSTYLRCKIDRRTPESDPVKRGYPRMRSLDADAFHSNAATKGPAIIDCTAKFQGDDCVNIHGTYYMIFASAGGQLRVAGGGGGKLNFATGDPVEFLPFNGKRPPNAVVTSIEPDEPLTDAEKAFVSKLNLNDHIRAELASGKPRVFKITLDHPTDLLMGSLICSGKRVGNGFLVQGCDFGYNRSRGILIKASQGQVSGNKITHSRMAAVLVSPEFWWFEAASSSEVRIENNTITGCLATGIEIAAPGGDGKPLASGAHQNINITGNTISDSRWPNVSVTSTSGLVVEGNHFTAANADGTPPLAGHRWNWGAAKPSPVVTEQCENARLQAAP
jgi:Right handed beta helix region